MESTSIDQSWKQLDAQPVGQAGGFRFFGQCAGRAGLDAAQAALAIAIVDAGHLALELGARLAGALGDDRLFELPRRPAIGVP